MFETPDPQARRNIAEFDLRLRRRLHVAFLLTNFAQPGQRNAKEIALQDGTQQETSRRTVVNGTKYVTFKKEEE
jgi:hypothetical protein